MRSYYSKKVNKTNIGSYYSKKINKKNIGSKSKKKRLSMNKRRKNKVRRFTKKIKTYKKLIGGIKAKAEFLFKEHFSEIKQQLLSEKEYFSEELKKSTTQFDDNLNIPIDESKTINERDALLNKELSILFTIILKKLIDMTREQKKLNEKQAIIFMNDNIEWIIKSYINFTFRLDDKEPLTTNLLFTNYPKFLILYDNLNYILTNKNIMFDAFKLKLKEKLGDINQLELKQQNIKDILEEKNNILKKFNSLIDLQLFLNDYKTEIDEIQEALKNIDLKKRGKGEGNVEVLVDTPNLVLHKILSKAGSLCYGSNTTWCTATTSFFNKYDNYSKTGELYILQDKNRVNHKYQMHIVSGQLRDDTDKPVSIHEVLESFNNDEELKKYFDDLSLTFSSIPLETLYDFKYIEKESKLVINIRGLYYDFIYNNLNKEDFIQLLREYLIKNNLQGLKTLAFGNMFNQELGNSLDSLVNLETLTFGNDFNQELGNSLDNLVNLKTLTFGKNFTKNIPEKFK
jgi:hypothetical protein